MRGLNIVKTAVLPRLTYRFNAVPIKILADFFFFAEIDKFKIHMETRETQISQNNVEKGEQNFRTHNFLFQYSLQR